MYWGRLAAILHLIFWVEIGHADTPTSCWTSGNWSCMGEQNTHLILLQFFKTEFNQTLHIEHDLNYGGNISDLDLGIVQE